jgi:hypothetical protein
MTHLCLLTHEQFILGDGIIIWRTWIIWQKQNFVLYLTVPFLIGSLGTSISLIRLAADLMGPVCSIINVVKLPEDAFLLPVIVQSFARSWFGFTALIITLTTNVLTTVLVACKTWCACMISPFLTAYNILIGCIIEICAPL